MDELIKVMKVAFATEYTFYLKAHFFHWNVEGPNFYQYHKLFGKLYEELHGAVDPIAEEIRSLDAYAPGSFTRFLELTEIEDETNIPMAREMAIKLLRDTDTVLNTLNVAFKLADQFDRQGLADFVAGRIDVHNKHAWMLRSITK